MRRRRRKNPSTMVYVGLGVGVLAAGGIAFFAFRAHEATASGAAGTALASAQAAGGVLATVVTSDPAPAGDLAVRSGPSDSAPVIGGAEKGGTVIVLDGNASADYARIEWDGGPRRPAVQGFAHKAFLSLV